jgi:2-dehydro-3-deoxyphosphogluconate aldolase/(4S)-4-hydroxy-2-oxoglutarate aldolase
MAFYSRLDVLNNIIDAGLVPVFYNADVEVAKKVMRACLSGGSRLLEFTNRGDFAPEVFKELSLYCRKEAPQVILGVGSKLQLHFISRMELIS